MKQKVRLLDAIGWGLAWAGFLMVVFILYSVQARAQDTVYTYCENNEGRVVLVTDHTCPEGYWPI